MVTLTFSWSWWAFAIGALSLLVVEIVVLFWIAAVQYRNNKKKSERVWDAMGAWAKDGKTK